MSENGDAGKAPEMRDRDENGHFLPGHSIRSPGCPPKPNWYSSWHVVARDVMGLEGRAADEWVIARVITMAQDGDWRAIKELADRIYGAIPKTPDVNLFEVDVDARSVTVQDAGSVPPEGKELGDYIQALMKIGREQGIIDD